MPSKALCSPPCGEAWCPLVLLWIDPHALASLVEGEVVLIGWGRRGACFGALAVGHGAHLVKVFSVELYLLGASPLVLPPPLVSDSCQLLLLDVVQPLLLLQPK